MCGGKNVITFQIDVFNEICTGENIPQQWTVASVCRIYKKGD
jgi:hypothetical protein